MKTKKSIKNVITSLITNFINIFIRMISQTLFISIMGAEFLGINGVFSNVVSMLSIVELGIGSAIIYNLYKPMKENNSEMIKSLSRFYRNAYILISIIIIVLGLLLIPFLDYIVTGLTVKVNIIFVYLLFLFEVICSYVLSFKRSILYADQKNYVINNIHIIYLVLLNIIQILILYFTKNYYLYLLLKVFSILLENITISIIVDNKYPFLKEKNVKKLDKETEKDIYKKVGALFFHQIGAYIVLGTDNIIISSFFGIVIVGLYSNYYLIVNSVNNLISQALKAVTPSVGHLLVENDYKKNFDIFSKIRFLNSWIAIFSSTSILVIMEPFINIWIGKNYLLPFLALCIISLNFYQTIMRHSFGIFKEAAGIYYEDRFVPLIEALLNIIFSILCLKFFGVAGVFMGTFVSSLTLWFYSYPKYVYKKIFMRSYKLYIKEMINYFILFICILITTYFISNIFVSQNDYVRLFFNISICCLIPNIILLLLYHNDENFIYFKNLFINLIKKEKNT